MNGFWLLIPFLAIRFGLMRWCDPNAISRAAHFAPMEGREKAAYGLYQISNMGMFLYLLFLTVKYEDSLFFLLGAACYGIGLCLCWIAVADFSKPGPDGMNTRGIYRFSRNPMYVSYLICFLGMALLTRSLILLGLLILFQIAAHWIILAEERWCLEQFGEAYRDYQKRVRRYL